jgi:hypothetical protein
MQTAYKDLNIQLLPSKILQELNQNSKMISHFSHISESFSTKVISQDSFLQGSNLNYNEGFSTLLNQIFS